MARRSRPLVFLRDLIVIAVIAVLASFLIRTFLVESFFIPSASMENTLLGDRGRHDHILVARLVPRLVPLQRGDVIVFEDPGGWLRGSEANPRGSAATSALQQALEALDPVGGDDRDHLVKRLIGLPGDRVVCCDAQGRMSVNGTPLAEPYIRLPRGETAVSRDHFDVVVPRGRLWVMGDNRDDSADSRYNRDTPSKGFVPITNVTGRAFVIAWPVSRWSWLSNYPATFAGHVTTGSAAVARAATAGTGSSRP